MRSLTMLSRKPIFVILPLTILITVIAWVHYSAHMDLKSAISGYTPFEWLTIIKNPHILEHGFYAGPTKLSNSLFMHIYLLADKFLGIPANIMTNIVIAIELFFIALAIYIFLKSVFSEDDNWKFFIMFFVVYAYFISSNALYSELTRFGGPWIAGLYYNIADSLRILSIAALLRKRYVLASALISASFLTHPIYGIIGCFFIFSAQLGIAKTLNRDDYKKILYGIAIFSIFAVFWYLFATGNGTTTELKIPQKEWLHWSVISNFHWFPVEYGLLGGHHHERLLGFLSVILLFLYSIACKKHITLVDRQIYYGMVGMFFLVVIGIAISWYKPNPTFIKLSLGRASLLMLEISIFYISYRFINDLFDIKKSVLIRSLSLSLLLAPFILPNAFPLLVVVLLVVRPLTFFNNRQQDRVFVITSRVFFVSAVISILFLTINNNPNISDLYRYIGNPKVWLIFVFSYLAIHIFRTTKNHLYSYLAMLFLLSLLSYNWLSGNKKSGNFVDEATAYKNIQDWANKNTNEEALFFVDPSILYGWRAYSQRASFGNLREWTHVTWNYSENYQHYTEGMKRFDEFSIDSHSKRYAPQEGMVQFTILLGDVRSRFYSADTNWFQQLGKKYGIDFVIMQNAYMQQNLDFQKVYENTHFTAYKIRI